MVPLIETVHKLLAGTPRAFVLFVALKRRGKP
jgi:hypothetical protein